jgi:hypothetical protein
MDQDLYYANREAKKRLDKKYGPNNVAYEMEMGLSPEKYREFVTEMIEESKKVQDDYSFVDNYLVDGKEQIYKLRDFKDNKEKLNELIFKIMHNEVAAVHPESPMLVQKPKENKKRGLLSLLKLRRT